MFFCNAGKYILNIKNEKISQIWLLKIDLRAIMCLEMIWGKIYVTGI